MIWYHGIPDASVVFLLLLLFFTPSGLGEDCFWKHRPFPTTDPSSHVRKLEKWLLLDYPVFVPTNLKPDDFCQKIWDLHFVNRELIRMINISGYNLTVLIKQITSITNFVADCKIKEDDCINFEQRNVSQFLKTIPPLFTALNQHMNSLDEEDVIDFSNCTVLQCQLDSSHQTVTKQTPITNVTTPVTKQAEQKTEERQSSQPATSRKHYWWLILLLIGLLLAFVVGARLQCRKRSQRSPRNQPVEPTEAEHLQERQSSSKLWVFGCNRF